MTMAKEKLNPHVDAGCAQCGVDLAVKTMPISCDGKKFCPQCFVWQYAHTQPERWDWNQMASVCCKKCGTLSVDFGSKCCGYCGDNKLRILGSK